MKFSKGFSLTELIVVVAIFIILTSVVLINQNRFSSTISIQNLAYQISLTIRQAQVYGLSVRGSKVGSVSTFDTAFGIQFNSATPTQFIFFADLNKDKKYILADDGLPISTFTLDSGSIKDVCTTSALIIHCFGSTGTNKITTADIIFQRPNPEAIISDDLSLVGDPGKSQIQITLQSAIKDKVQNIFVTRPGQIYVTN